MNYLELLSNEHSATVCLMEESDIDIVMGRNMRRLRLARGLSQEELAEKMGQGVTKQRISAIENGREGMGKYLLAQACDALKARTWEFYIEEDTPIITDPGEQQKVYRYRLEQDLGIAEEVARYEDYRIDQAKKKETTGAEGTESGVPRHRDRRRGERRRSG